MLLNIKLLCLAEILVIVSLIEKIAGNFENVEDDDASIKQALFLIKLLKSDFGKIFRSSGIGNDEVTTKFTEDANSTCGLRSDDSNTTSPTSTTPISTAVMGFNRRMMPDFTNFRRQGEISNKTTETRDEIKNGKTLNNTTTKPRQGAKRDPIESENDKNPNSTTTKSRRGAKHDQVELKNGKNLNSTTTKPRRGAKRDPIESKNGKNLNSTTTKQRRGAKHNRIDSKNGKILRNSGESSNNDSDEEDDPDDDSEDEENNSESDVESQNGPKSSLKPSTVTTKGTTKTKRTTTETTAKTFRSSLKIFLQNSSRLPIPFSENNAFCHFYPTNPICGSAK